MSSGLVLRYASQSFKKKGKIEMRIRAIELGRAQRGWVCDVFFTVQTLRAFTPEEMDVRSGGRWIWSAIWNGIRDAKRKALSEEATPDEMKRHGWSK
jgi:hypothetical protein